jgi:hypothetical protein
MAAPQSETTLDSLTSGWKTKIEAEADSVLDEYNRLSGHEIEADIKTRKKLADSWDFVLGTEFSQSNTKGKMMSNRWEEVSVGVRYTFYTGSLKWKAQPLYSYLPDAEKRLKKSRNGALALDLRTKLHFSHWGKGRVRAKYTEYLRTSGQEKIDLRRYKIDFKPTLILGQWDLGLANKYQHKYQVSSERNFFETGPFVKWTANKTLELAFKTTFRPFVSHDQQLWADEYEKRPTYSIEAEIKL